MSEQIEACPECDSARLYKRRSDYREYEVDHGYVCEDCGARFDTAIEREPKVASGNNLSAGGQLLEAAEPEDWP